MRRYEAEIEDYYGHFFHHRFEAKDDDEQSEDEQSDKKEGDSKK